VRNLLRPENSHRYLAMRRGWMEEELVMTLGGPTPPAPADLAAQTGAPAGPADPLVEELLHGF